MQLRKVSQGRTTPADINADARAIVHDHGVTHGPDVALSKLGACGRHDGNMERDLHRYVSRELPATLEPWSVDVPHHPQHEPGARLKPCSVMFAHEVISAFWTQGRSEFHRVFLGRPDGTPHGVETFFIAWGAQLG